MSDKYKFRCSVNRVVDGDTYDLNLFLFFGLQFDIRLRLSNLDTSEIYGVEHTSEEYKLGKEQMEFAKEWIDARNGREYPFKAVTTKNKGKYGRYVGIIEDADTGETLNDALCEEYPEISENIFTSESEGEVLGLVGDERERHRLLSKQYLLEQAQSHLRK